MKKPLPDFKLRLPTILKERIEEAARGNNRSMNGEIVARLEESFGQPKSLIAKLAAAAKASRLDDLEKRVAALEGAAGIPDFVTSGRLDSVEERLATIEAAIFPAEPGRKPTQPG